MKTQFRHPAQLYRGLKLKYLRYRLRYILSTIAAFFIIYNLLHTYHPRPQHNSALDDHSHLYSTRRHPTIQHEFPTMRPGAGADLPRLAAVKAEFTHAYHGYRTRAWMHDGLKPVTGGSYTQYCGWAATLIDALDTLYIMGMWEEFDEAVEAVVRMRLSWAPSLLCSVNPFEMTIRHLGGLLAAWDVSGGRDERLRFKAREMGEMMWKAYAKNGIQCRNIVWPQLPGWGCEPNPTLSLARLGSQSVELLRLGMVTGEEKWGRKASWLAEEMERVQGSSNMPGLFPQFFDGTCADGLCDLNPVHQTFTLGSAADSAYEYLVKSHLLHGRADKSYLKMWERALPEIKKHLLFHPKAPNGSELMFPGTVIAQGSKVNALRGKVEHLSCFLGGLFALSARTSVKDSEDLEIAAKLTEGCVWAYASTPSGIMPDTTIITPCRGGKKECYDTPKSQIGSDGALPAGFEKIERPEYILRPEAIESVFVMYRTTGDEKWRDKGWDMFVAIRNATRSEYGHSAILDVMKRPGDIAQSDKMESFWFSETLKYFYLLFADPSMVSLDDWMFNTEGHTLRLEDHSTISLPLGKHIGIAGRFHGVATLIRRDILSSVSITISRPAWDLEGRILIHSFPDYNLVVLNGYWVNGTNHAYRNPVTEHVDGQTTRHGLKLRYHEQILALVLQYQKKEGKAVILVGDMNIAPARVDGYPNLRLSPIQHVRNRKNFNEKFLGLEGGGGMNGVDLFRHLHGQQRKYTWHSTNAPHGTLCDRVDLIIASRSPGWGRKLGHY